MAQSGYYYLRLKESDSFRLGQRPGSESWCFRVTFPVRKSLCSYFDGASVACAPDTSGTPEIMLTKSGDLFGDVRQFDSFEAVYQELLRLSDPRATFSDAGSDSETDDVDASAAVDDDADDADATADDATYGADDTDATCKLSLDALD
jgi:hypothetical protein